MRNNGKHRFWCLYNSNRDHSGASFRTKEIDNKAESKNKRKE